MYLMLGSRPDICFALNYFSRYQDKATDEMYNYLTRILRYLRGTKDYELIYGTGVGTDGSLEAYIDSNWANDDDRRSVSGYVYKWNGDTNIVGY